ncbi:hypothetical protein SK128_022339 [Halocaridina rubra]|uniref:XK-related protein n=1 Tax=Halocaridina rubra TaxID=373956 RepID=A0AAN8ZSY8_HALRR
MPSGTIRPDSMGSGDGSYINSATLMYPSLDGLTDIPLDDQAKPFTISDSVSSQNAMGDTIDGTPNAMRRAYGARPRIEDVRQNIYQATNQAGRALATGTNVAGRAIYNGTNVAGRAIYNGTNVASRALATGMNVASREIANGAKQGLKNFTQPMQMSKFGWFDILTALLSIGMFYFDIVSDLLVAYYMYNDEATQEWFLPTLLLILIPLVMVNGFSLYWYWFDERVCVHEGVCNRSPRINPALWTLRIIGHILLQAPILRYIDLLHYGRKSMKRKPIETCQNSEHLECQQINGDGQGTSSPQHDDLKYYNLWIHAERDASNVDLLSALLQDAPQLILQLYIMARTIPDLFQDGQISDTLIFQMLSVCASLVAMAWSVGSFSKATRLAEPSLGNLSPAGLILLSLAHFCCIGPQVLCFALFSTAYLYIFMIIVSCHWLAMTLLVLFTLICCPSPVRVNATFTHDMRDGPCHRLDDIFFSAAFGLILLYTFVDVGGKGPKIQGVVFHTLRLAEEACMIAFWYLSTAGTMWYHWLPLVIVGLFFLLSLVFTSLYFFCAYPDTLNLRRSRAVADQKEVT